MAHSADDDIAPIQCGFDLYFEKYSDNPRFKFVRYEDKGHFNILYSQDAVTYMDAFTKAKDEYFGGKNPPEEEVAEYFKKNLDRNVYSNRVDKELFGKIVEFFDSYL